MATRRIRIVCISDTHNQTPTLPKGDILIHAGDLTNQGSYSELRKIHEWVKKARFKVKIVIAGNHDITLDTAFYEQHGKYFHNKQLEDTERCQDLFRSDPDIVYLQHEAKDIRFAHEDGTFSLLKVFGSPYSPTHRLWAFGYTPAAAPERWSDIPLDADIVITHTPAKFHLDACSTRGATAGCEALRQALWRVRPRLFVCGHIHEAYGVEVVDWDLLSTNVKYREFVVTGYTDPDPTSKKQFKVDLSSRTKSLFLQNDGDDRTLLVPASTVPVDLHRLSSLTLAEKDSDFHESHGSPSKENLLDLSRRPTLPFPDHDKAIPSPSFTTSETPILERGVQDQGGLAMNDWRDREAILGRDGRKQTCFVNAAFMANNYPHDGGKRFHKPIVIDLDLSCHL